MAISFNKVILAQKINMHINIYLKAFLKIHKTMEIDFFPSACKNIKSTENILGFEDAWWIEKVCPFIKQTEC